MRDVAGDMLGDLADRSTARLLLLLLLLLRE
jgi:hypothetical protein